MRHGFVLFLSAICMLISPLTTLAADECNISGWGEIGVFNKYMFRGVKSYDGTSIQPAGGAVYSMGEMGSISGWSWMHISGENDSTPEKFTELDFTLEYNLVLNKIGFRAGHGWYLYPDGDDDLNDTAELFVGLSLNEFIAHPTFTFYQDYREYDLQFYELKFSEEFRAPSLGDSFNITPYILFGFASNVNHAYDDDGLELISIGASTSTKLGILDLKPEVHYNFKIDDYTSNQLWFGIKVAYSNQS